MAEDEACRNKDLNWQLRKQISNCIDYRLHGNDVKHLLVMSKKPYD